MADITISPNMMLPVPTVGVDSGPDWAENINSCLSLVDAHDHSSGNGVKVTPAGLNISSDLAFGSNNATTLRSVRLSSQTSTLAAATDLGCLYNVSGNLYYNYGVTGAAVQITSGGSIVGTPGSIAGLTSPASATYVSANSTFVWQSDSNKAAIMDSGPIITRNTTTSSFGITLQAPTLTGDYTLTWPTIPVSQKIMTLDASGIMSGAYLLDNATITIYSGGVIQIADQGVNTTQLKDGSVTSVKISNLEVTTGKLADQAVTAAKIANGTITTTQIASSTIVAGNISNATITGSKIASATITATNIANTTITGAKLVNGTITGTQIVSSVSLPGFNVQVGGAYPSVNEAVPLLVVRGIFNGSTVVSGGRFAVTAVLPVLTDIVYVLTWTSAFDDDPTVVCTPGSQGYITTVDSVSTTQATIRLHPLSGSASNVDIHVFAIGGR